MESGLPSIVTGTSYSLSITVKIDGYAVDITGDTVTMTIKSDADDSDAQAVLQVNGDVLTGGADGIVEWNLTPAQTEIAPGQYYIDFVWYTLSGDEHLLPIKDAIYVTGRVSDP